MSVWPALVSRQSLSGCCLAKHSLSGHKATAVADAVAVAVVKTLAAVGAVSAAGELPPSRRATTHQHLVAVAVAVAAIAVVSLRVITKHFTNARRAGKTNMGNSDRRADTLRAVLKANYLLQLLLRDELSCFKYHSRYFELSSQSCSTSRYPSYTV